MRSARHARRKSGGSSRTTSRVFCSELSGSSRAVRGILFHVTQTWNSKLILARCYLTGAYLVRAASLPTPPRYPSHASPALTDSSSSSPFSRAMTCCLPSAGRGLSTTLVFGVAQTLLAFLRDLREKDGFGFQDMHRTAVVCGSGAVRWSVGCGVAPVVEVSVLLTSL